jgi:hypothetical protein
MRFRLQAFAAHLISSVCVLSLVLGILYFGWYRWPGWYLTHALHVVLIAALVDLGIGPTHTLVVANPTKARRALGRDIAIIVCVQLVALVYGAFTLWHARPLYYTFSEDRLEVVQADEISAAEAEAGRRENPQFAPHWYSLPSWVWAPLPEDPATARRIMTSAIMGGSDVVDMPRYFKPWAQGLPRLRAQLAAVTALTILSKAEKDRAQVLFASLGVSPQERNSLVLYGYMSHLVAVFDPNTLRVRAILDVS